MNKLKVGDTIKCHDINDMVETSTALAREDIYTDFRFGRLGFGLEVTHVGPLPDPNEEIKKKMCDEYCKFPSICSEEELQERCKNCPLEEIQ